MNNLNEYRKRFRTLMESTIGDVKPLINEVENKVVEIIENTYAPATSINIITKNFGMVRGQMYTRYQDVTIDKRRMSVEFFPDYTKDVAEPTAKATFNFEYDNDEKTNAKLYFSIIGPDNVSDTTEAIIIPPSGDDDSYVRLKVEVNFSKKGNYVVKMNDPSKYYQGDSNYTDGQLRFSVF